MHLKIESPELLSNTLVTEKMNVEFFIKNIRKRITKRLWAPHANFSDTSKK